MSNVVVFNVDEQVILSEGGVENTGENKEYCVRRPTANQQREGQKSYNRAFNDALESGCILRAKLDGLMRTQGMWDDDKQTELTEINRKISNGERRIDAGGFELKDAVALAKQIREERASLRRLVSVRSELDVNTAEGQADNARFNYFVSVCLVYNDTQKPVFTNLDEYIANSATEQASEGATKLAQMMYGISDDFESKYSEIKFMREFGIMDNKNRYIDEDGHLVDSDGKLINEDGYYVLEDGTLCDMDGNPMDEDGNYIVEKKPFLRDGEPIQSKDETLSPAQQE